MAAVDSFPAFTKPKVVEKAFSLPIVSDSYSYGKITLIGLNLSRVSHGIDFPIIPFPTVENFGHVSIFDTLQFSSLTPPGLDTVCCLASALHLSSSLASLPPLLSSHLCSLQALGEARLPGMVTAKIYMARDQVANLRFRNLWLPLP